MLESNCTRARATNMKKSCYLYQSEGTGLRSPGSDDVRRIRPEREKEETGADGRRRTWPWIV